MNIIKNIFDSQRKHFEKGGRFERLYPIFEATETFFFIPETVTQKDPHVRDSLDVKRFMTFVILALMPPFIFGIYNAGFQALAVGGLKVSFLDAFAKGLILVLPIVIVSYTVGFLWEFLFATVRRHDVSEGFLVTGLLFPLTLPPTIPLWQAAVGISFGVVIGKEIFGGTGRNILNPALTGRAFIFFAFPSKMSGDQVWTAVSQTAGQVADAVSGATPLGIAGLVEQTSQIQATLLDKGYGFFKMFLGLHPGCIGETSALLCFLGALFLAVTGIASYRIIIGGILGVLSAGFLLNLLSPFYGSAWFALNPFYHLVMGGFAFGIAFMATDPVSAPGMNKAKWVYGFMIGVLTILIRVFNPAFVEGVMLAILFMNVFSPSLDYFEIQARLKKRVPNV